MHTRTTRLSAWVGLCKWEGHGLGLLLTNLLGQIRLLVFRKLSLPHLVSISITILYKLLFMIFLYQTSFIFVGFTSTSIYSLKLSATAWHTLKTLNIPPKLFLVTVQRSPSLFDLVCSSSSQLAMYSLRSIANESPVYDFNMQNQF